MTTAKPYAQGFGRFSSESPRAARRIPYILTGVAVLSAFTVFLSLCERDHTLLLTSTSARRVSPLVPSRTAAAVSADPEPASDSITRVSVPSAAAAAPASEPLLAHGHTDSLTSEKHSARHLFQFTLSRSRRYQQVGPVLVGVWKIDAKHKLYDISVLSAGHRVDRKRVALDSPVWISASDSSRPLQLVVNSIDRSVISGYLSEGQTAR